MTGRLLLMFLVMLMCVWAAMTSVAVDYFSSKRVPYVSYLTCGSKLSNKNQVYDLIRNGIRVSMQIIDTNDADVKENLQQWLVPVGVLLEWGCDGSQIVLESASRASLFDSVHMWLILENEILSDASVSTSFDVLRRMNLSVDSDVVVATNKGVQYDLIDVFNFGKIQGNDLEKKHIGTWRPGKGLNISLSGFKYYDRWDFHNLTLRAISVILDRPKVFKPEMLSDLGYTAGVSVMTKIVTQQLWVLKEMHNFRFNYTIAGRWIGSPARNSTLAVTNSLYWGEQDISCTCARIFTQWLDWVDVFFPSSTKLDNVVFLLVSKVTRAPGGIRDEVGNALAILLVLQASISYGNRLPSEKGVGSYENRFLTPLSPGVWWCTIIACVACTIILAISAYLETREEPGLYAAFSVYAVICQQAYEDGVQLFEEATSSQGRRLILLVVGLMSMLLYNYYTSSVVSWLLNAAAPTLADMDALINSDLELVFEDIGYTRGWLDNPGFFYYSGYKNPKEDYLRMRKVTMAKRTTPILQEAAAGINLIRTGDYAYHTEPYTAYQVLSKTFEDKELCELGSLQMMSPAHVYIMAQKRSPYKQFFVWSLMRLLERGHTSAVRARVSGYRSTCSGRTPRALALGQAAPAFIVLAQVALFSVIILLCEIYWHRVQGKKQAGSTLNNREHNAQEVRTRTDSQGA